VGLQASGGNSMSDATGPLSSGSKFIDTYGSINSRAGILPEEMSRNALNDFFSVIQTQIEQSKTLDNASLRDVSAISTEMSVKNTESQMEMNLSDSMLKAQVTVLSSPLT